MLAIIIITSLVPTVYANEYMGSYFDCTRTTTDCVVMYADPAGTSYGSLPNDEWVAGVMSVAGENNTGGLSGFIYQSGFHCIDDGDIEWAPQTWYCDSLGSPWDYDDYTVNSMGNYELLFTTIELDTNENEITSKAYVYEDDYDVTNDLPVIWTNTHDGNYDENLLVGTYYDAQEEVTYKLFQVGVEATSDLSCYWKMYTKWFGYRTVSGYLYRTCKSCTRPNSAISHDSNGDPKALASGTLYRANIDSCTYDTVTWERGSSTLSNDYTFWTGTGDPEDTCDMETPFP